MEKSLVHLPKDDELDHARQWFASLSDDDAAFMLKWLIVGLKLGAHCDDIKEVSEEERKRCERAARGVQGILVGSFKVPPE